MSSFDAPGAARPSSLSMLVRTSFRNPAGDRTGPRPLPRQRMAAMSAKKTYVAVYERDAVDDAWNVRIDGLEGCQIYGRGLRQAQSRIREALALWLDRDPSKLVIEDRMPAKLAAVADRVGKARVEAE